MQKKNGAGVRAAVIAFFLLLPPLESANILFFMGVSTYSHRLLVWPLVEKLVSGGHNITFYQPLKSKTQHPKVHHYFPSSLEDLLAKVEPRVMYENNFLSLRLTRGRSGIQESLATEMPLVGIKYCEAFLSVPETQDLVQPGRFDLVIIDSLFNECGYGVAYKAGARVIVFGTFTISPWNHDVFGLPWENSWVPDIIFSSSVYPIPFLERVFTTLIHLYITHQRTHNYMNGLEELLRPKLNIPEMPDLLDLERKTDLILINSHFSEDLPRSLPPFVVSVGGLHCPDPQQDFKPNPLPQV